MLSLGRRFKVLSVIMLLIGSMGILSSCASKKKDYTAKTNPFPYNVVDVSVTSLDPAGDEFAMQLEFNLKQAVGSPAFAEARDVILYVQTHPSGVLDQSAKSLFRQVQSLGGANVTATIRIMDSEDGSSLNYEQITSSSTKDDIEIANLFIEEDMIAQIRAILGLTIFPPRPISYVETSVNARQSERLNGAKLVFKPKQQRADPLLNGQITSQTKSSDIMKQVKEMDKRMSSDAIDMKRKVNGEAKMVKDVLMEDMPAQKEETMLDKEIALEKKMADTMKKVDDALEEETIEESDLCIVTVENDCLGPNISE